MCWRPRYTESRGREQRICLAKLLPCLAAKPPRGSGDMLNSSDLIVCVYCTPLHSVNMLSVQERPSMPTVTTDCHSGLFTCLCPSPSAPFMSRAVWQMVKGKMEKQALRVPGLPLTGIRVALGLYL